MCSACVCTIFSSRRAWTWLKGFPCLLPTSIHRSLFLISQRVPLCADVLDLKISSKCTALNSYVNIHTPSKMSSRPVMFIICPKGKPLHHGKLYVFLSLIIHFQSIKSFFPLSTPQGFFCALWNELQRIKLHLKRQIHDYSKCSLS